MGRESLMNRMVIDCERVSSVIVDFIRTKVKEQKKNGVALGLSGGLDSATVAVLAAKAVGPSNVYTLYLPDRDSERKFKEHAKEIADKLGVNFAIREIGKAVKEEGAYEPLIMRVTKFHPFLNRLITFSSNRIIYPLVFRETPFVVTLKKGGSAKNIFARIVYNAIAAPIENGFNIRHIQRRRILENYATENNLLLIGAANRSESFVGWFVKDGIDDLPVETLLGLYKDQVRQLAQFLVVPREILAEAPSPDMFKGIGDEDIIGYPYENIDKVAYILEHDVDRQLAYDEGITPHEFEAIENLNRLSVWKRENKREFPTLK